MLGKLAINNMEFTHPSCLEVTPIGLLINGGLCLSNLANPANLSFFEPPHQKNAAQVA